RVDHVAEDQALLLRIVKKDRADTGVDGFDRCVERLSLQVVEVGPGVQRGGDAIDRTQLALPAAQALLEALRRWGGIRGHRLPLRDQTVWTPYRSTARPRIPPRGHGGPGLAAEPARALVGQNSVRLWRASGSARVNPIATQASRFRHGGPWVLCRRGAIRVPCGRVSAPVRMAGPPP